jgi:hypoxanthine phosphoribosyltransferase
MTMSSPGLGNRILLVDDMVDSGHTLEAVAKALPLRFPHIREQRTAVVWWKACSVCRPDFHIQYLAENPWIHQPFEIYDTMRSTELKARLGALPIER